MFSCHLLSPLVRVHTLLACSDVDGTATYGHGTGTLTYDDTRGGGVYGDYGAPDAVAGYVRLGVINVDRW